ncbi:MAG: hypothetical protein IJ128_05675 [Firmicutes bacterium]|nr:hypothetical protein [Bacillota bacterium]
MNTALCKNLPRVKDGYVDFGTHLLGEGGAHVYETMKVFSRKGYSGDLKVLKGWVAEL